MAIHPTALVHPRAELDPTVEVGPYCVIDPHVRIAAGCRLYQNAFLTGWTEIGEGCTLHPGVVVGHEPQDVKYKGERTFCRVGRRCTFREYVTIHRGTIPDSATTVGDDAFFLAGSHVGHNCTVGDRVTLINNALLGGHVEVGDRVTIGGGAAVHQFVRIGELAMVRGLAGVNMDLPPFALADEDGRVAGLNRVGLRRAEIPPADRREIREAYRILYAPGFLFANVLDRLRTLVQTPSGRKLLSFLEAPSKRGLSGPPRRRRLNSADGELRTDAE